MNYRKFTSITILLLWLLVSLQINAQPPQVKKTAEGVFTITTFKADGSILATSHGFFISNNGMAVSSAETFKNAASAVVIDSRGQKRSVERIVGYNDIYNVIKFKVNGATKGLALTSNKAKEGEKMWGIPYSNKTVSPILLGIKGVETFNEKYSYIILSSAENAESLDACPLVNDNGQVVGIVQQAKLSTDLHATDASFAADITANALSFNDNDLRQISIPLMLPSDENQAKLALLFAQQCGEQKYEATINDFTSSYPKLIDGYLAEARLRVSQKEYAKANDIMGKALKNVTDTDDAHYNYAKLIYQTELDQPDNNYAEWSFSLAKSEVEKAYSIKPLSLYKFLEGNILYATSDYQGAYDTFLSLMNSDMKGGDLYYEAARCKIAMKAPDTEVLALLDSAVNNVDTLSYRSAAQYFLMRAGVYEKMENYRQAVFDYTRYEVLVGQQLSSEFYYTREQAELKTKLFKQALADIQRALILSPQEPLYYAELGSLQLRLGMYKEAEVTGSKLVELAPEYSEGFLIIGLAQIKQDNKKDGIENLKKASGLGNEQAGQMIEKYK